MKSSQRLAPIRHYARVDRIGGLFQQEPAGSHHTGDVIPFYIDGGIQSITILSQVVSGVGSGDFDAGDTWTYESSPADNVVVPDQVREPDGTLVWDDINGNLGQWDKRDVAAVLPYKESRDEEDEKHVHPLQLDVIRRTVDLRTNPGETVFTPFLGVGSEVYAAVELGRLGVGAELKPSYYRQAVKNLASLGDLAQAEQEILL